MRQRRTGEMSKSRSHTLKVKTQLCGVLVDLCWLTIERFRQDTILYELFGPELEDFEAHMRDRLEGVDPTSNLSPIIS